MGGSKNYGTFTQCNTTKELKKKKKEILPFVTAWMEFEVIIVSEISQ